MPDRTGFDPELVAPLRARLNQHPVYGLRDLDAGFHGPLSLRMLDMLIAGDPVKLEEARDAAEAAIEARIRFWDGVHAGLAEAA